MSLLTSAVNVITTEGTTGKHGFTASAVCSVTDTPATLLVCMNQSSRSYHHFIDNKVLAVNVLSSQHESLANAFASSTLNSIQRFQLGSWSTLATASPILTDALVSFDCEIVDVHQVGTHSIFICRVLALTPNQQQPSLVYFNRTYHQVSELQIA